jgi:hypothetical protein
LAQTKKGLAGFSYLKNKEIMKPTFDFADKLLICMKIILLLSQPFSKNCSLYIKTTL